MKKGVSFFFIETKYLQPNELTHSLHQSLFLECISQLIAWQNDGLDIEPGNFTVKEAFKCFDSTNLNTHRHPPLHCPYPLHHPRCIILAYHPLKNNPPPHTIQAAMDTKSRPLSILPFFFPSFTILVIIPQGHTTSLTSTHTTHLPTHYIARKHHRLYILTPI